MHAFFEIVLYTLKLLFSIRILAFKILYYSFVNRRMASNEKDHRNQTSHMQFKLLLGSIFIMAIRIIHS